MKVEIEDVDYPKLCEILKNNRYACYGAGRAFENFCNRVVLPDNLGHNLKAIIDRNSELWGTKREFKGLLIDIISPQNARNVNIDVLVITAAEKGLLEKIEGMDWAQRFDCYLYSDIIRKKEKYRAENLDLSRGFRILNKPIIPKTIHYCWFGKNPIPEKNRKWMDSWKRHCPDYRIVEWNENNYDISKSQFMIDAYEAKKWAFVADYARLDIVYSYGGIYLDTDVELLQPLDDFLFEEGFAGVEIGGYIALGLGFGARPRLPILREMMGIYQKGEHSDFSLKEAKEYKSVSDPEIQTEFMRNRYGFKETNRIENYDGLRVYPMPILCGKIDDQIFDLPWIYAIHHYDASWV